MKIKTTRKSHTQTIKQRSKGAGKRCFTTRTINVKSSKVSKPKKRK